MARCANCVSCLFAWLIMLSLLLGPTVLLHVLLRLFGGPSRPSFSINLSYNEALNMTRADDSPTNITIHFDLKLKNENVAVGIHYPDPINITFSYFPNVSLLVTLAKYTFDGFYQGNGKTRHVRDLVEANVFPSTVLEGTDMIAFRVDLVGTIRYKKAGSKRHKMELGCVVGVDYATSNKMQRGFIGLAEPGLDSKLREKPPPTSD